MAISETKVKTPWKHKAKAIFLGIVGFGAGFGTEGTSLILLNNDFREIPKDPKRSDASGITVSAFTPVTKKNDIATTVTLDKAIVADGSEVAVRVLNAKCDTLSTFYAEQGKTVSILVGLGKNPYQEKLALEVSNRSEEPVMRREFNIDTLFEDFKPEPQKPVMLFLFDYHHNEKFITLLNGYAANQRTIIADLQKHYGSNLLMIPEPDKYKLDAILPKLKAALPRSSPVQVFVSSHHNNLKETADSTLNTYFYDHYSFGEQSLKDADLNTFLHALNTNPKQLIVIHNACMVDPRNYDIGTHIITAQPDNWSISLPNLSGKLTCVAQEMIPLLARNASINELHDALDKNGTAKFQLLCNKVFKKIPQRPGINRDAPSLPPIIVDRNSATKQR